MMQQVQNFRYLAREADKEIINNALQYMAIIQEDVNRSHPGLISLEGGFVL